MRFCYFPTLLFAATSLVQLVTADLSRVELSLKRISAALTDLDAGIKNIPGGGDTSEAQRQTSNLLSVARVAIDELRLGAREIRRGPNVGAWEGLTLLPSLNSLSTQLDSSSKGWVYAKPMVRAAGMTQTVLELLMDASEATLVFSDTIIGKLPYIEQPLGTTYKNQFVAIIEKSVAEYKLA
jgi:hypothetical protein